MPFWKATGTEEHRDFPTPKFPKQKDKGGGAVIDPWKDAAEEKNCPSPPLIGPPPQGGGMSHVGPNRPGDNFGGHYTNGPHTSGT